MAWPIETDLIQPEDELYVYVHFNNVSYASVEPQLKETGIKDPQQSCDWNRYHTPEETRALIGLQYRFGKTTFKNPNEFFIAAHYVSDWLEVSDTVDLPNPQRIFHVPIQLEESEEGKPANRAHCEVHGEKSLQIRTEMARRARWAIAPPPSKEELKNYVIAHAPK